MQALQIRDQPGAREGGVRPRVCLAGLAETDNRL